MKNTNKQHKPLLIFLLVSVPSLILFFSRAVSVFLILEHCLVWMVNINFPYWNSSDCFSKCQWYWAFPKKKKKGAVREAVCRSSRYRNQDAIISCREGGESAGYISEGNGGILGMRETWKIDQWGRSGLFSHYLCFLPKVKQSKTEQKLAQDCALVFLSASCHLNPIHQRIISSLFEMF